MGSSQAAPAPQQQASTDPGFYWEGDKLVITGNPSSAAVVQTQHEHEAAKKAKSEADTQAARDKAIQGGESAADIASREASTLANPKKSKTRGQRSLVSSSSIGTGVTSSREILG